MKKQSHKLENKVPPTEELCPPHHSLSLDRDRSGDFYFKEGDMKLTNEYPKFESLEERIAYKKRLYTKAMESIERLEESKRSITTLVFYVFPAVIIGIAIFITLLLRR